MNIYPISCVECPAGELGGDEAHNINERRADPKYIEAITKNPKLETLFFTEGGGFSVTMKKR